MGSALYNPSGGSGGGSPTGAAGGSLAGTYPNPTIAAGAITDTEVAAANKDGAAGTASMRTLGTTATKACAGNDSRLSDSRAPNGAAGGDLTGTYPNPTLAAVITGATKGGSGKLVKSVTYDAKGRMSGDAIEAVAGTDYALPSGPAGLYLPIGLALATLTNDATLYEFRDDFTVAPTSAAVHGWGVGGGGSGALATQVPASAGGWWRLTSGASASGAETLQQFVPVISNVSTKKWWMAWRFQVSTAITAQTIAYVGLINIAGNKTVSMGVFGANSTANFVLQYDGNETGSFVSTGVAIDTNPHIIEMWGLGDSKVHARIDGGSDLGATTMSSAPSDAVYSRATVRDGTDNVVRQLDVDWVHVLTVRAP